MSVNSECALVRLTLHTINSEIFARTLFSRNFAYAKFREKKPSQNGKITLSFIDICTSCHSYEFLTSLICLLMPFAQKKILAKISESTVFAQVCLSLCWLINTKSLQPYFSVFSAGALKEFGKLLSRIEDERERMVRACSTNTGF